jgi:hypothetical protein
MRILSHKGSRLLKNADPSSRWGPMRVEIPGWAEASRSRRQDRHRWESWEDDLGGSVRNRAPPLAPPVALPLQVLVDVLPQRTVAEDALRHGGFVVHPRADRAHGLVGDTEVACHAPQS